jgi:hypothetical protein
MKVSIKFDPFISRNEFFTFAHQLRESAASICSSPIRSSPDSAMGQPVRGLDPLPPSKTANSESFLFALLEVVKELGFFGCFKVGAAILALYAAYKAIGLAMFCSKLWIER